VKASELKRWLGSQGCEFEEGANHWIVRLGDRMTTVPRHASKATRLARHPSEAGTAETEVDGMEHIAKFEPDPDGGFGIEFRDLATDRLTTTVREHIRTGKELPKPRKFRGPKYRPTALPASQGMKPNYTGLCVPPD
jgi:hypothetical protein